MRYILIFIFSLANFFLDKILASDLKFHIYSLNDKVFLKKHIKKNSPIPRNHTYSMMEKISFLDESIKKNTLRKRDSKSPSWKYSLRNKTLSAKNNSSDLLIVNSLANPITIFDLDPPNDKIQNSLNSETFQEVDPQDKTSSFQMLMIQAENIKNYCQWNEAFEKYKTISRMNDVDDVTYCYIWENLGDIGCILNISENEIINYYSLALECKNIYEAKRAEILNKRAQILFQMGDYLSAKTDIDLSEHYLKNIFNIKQNNKILKEKIINNLISQNQY